MVYRMGGALTSPASAQPGLRPANPRINFYLALQRLMGGVDYGTSEFMQHHERCLVASPRKLTLQE